MKNTLKKSIFTALAFFAAADFCAAQSGVSQNAPQANVSLNIRYYDKKVYFTEGEPIYILVTIANNSPVVYRFRLSDDRVFSVDFDARTRTNRVLEQADALERRRSTAGHIFFRDVAIEAGESFSFVENLRDYVNVDSAGSFIVQARVWPELLRTIDRQLTQVNAAAAAATAQAIAAQTIAAQNAPAVLKPLVSNRLALQVNSRAIIGDDGLPVALDVETGAALVRDKLVPDQVVRWTLEARQKSQWEKFFLYLNIEKMINRDGPRQRRWRAESEEGRRRMTANYRGELQKATIDGDISAIPFTFDIENTNYNSSEGTVVVLEKFKTGDYIERKRYTYYLEKEDEYWSIVDYTVMNLGTE